MADVRPVALVRGQVVKVSKFQLKTPDADGVVRHGANVSVLTLDHRGLPGGYAEVYIGADDWPGVLPAEGDLIEWYVEVGIFTRRGQRADGTPWQRSESSLAFVGVQVAMPRAVADAS